MHASFVSPLTMPMNDGGSEYYDDSQSVSMGSATTRSGPLTVFSSMDGTPAPSLYSYNSGRDGLGLLRNVAGRVLNAKNDLYLLPAGKSILIFSDHVIVQPRAYSVPYKDEGEHSRL